MKRESEKLKIKISLQLLYKVPKNIKTDAFLSFKPSETFAKNDVPNGCDKTYHQIISNIKEVGMHWGNPSDKNCQQKILLQISMILPIYLLLFEVK